MRVRHFNVMKITRVAEAVQLRREAQAAVKRHAEGTVAGDQDLVGRALARAAEIRAAVVRLRVDADLGREIALDRVLKQVDTSLTQISP